MVGSSPSYFSLSGITLKVGLVGAVRMERVFRKRGKVLAGFACAMPTTPEVRGSHLLYFCFCRPLRFVCLLNENHIDSEVSVAKNVSYTAEIAVATPDEPFVLVVYVGSHVLRTSEDGLPEQWIATKSNQCG